MRPRFQPEPRGNDFNDFIYTGIAVLFCMAIIIGLVLLISWYTRRHSQAQITSIQDPIDIAKVRYAKGEITKEEFEQLKKDLK